MFSKFFVEKVSKKFREVEKLNDVEVKSRDMTTKRRRLLNIGTKKSNKTHTRKRERERERERACVSVREREWMNMDINLTFL